MRNGKPASGMIDMHAVFPRRRALALLAGSSCGLLRCLGADANTAVRLAISESVIGDVNLNDARAAMHIWIKRMTEDLNLTVEFNPKVFDTTEEIVRRVRHAEVDSVALNILEYRQVAADLDASQIVAPAGPAGLVQYLILAKQQSGFRQLADLKGRRLCMLKGPRMCAAASWLNAVLDEAHLSPSEQFFSSIALDTKPARVVLPVFFGQADVCLTSSRGFETMCELNPQVGKDLVVIARSADLMASFYIFRKNYQGPGREKLIRALSSLRATAAGQQLATLFQFETMAVRDATCLGSALTVLETADRARSRQGSGRKG